MDNVGMEPKTAAPTFFTERSLATYLAVSDRTIRNWIRRGELPSYKLVVHQATFAVLTTARSFASSTL